METTEFILKAFREYNQINNNRQSITRETVLLELWNCTEEKDGDTLFIEMRKKGGTIKLGSVYNALSWLTEAGFLHKTYTDRKAKYFVLKKHSIELMNLDNMVVKSIASSK